MIRSQPEALDRNAGVVPPVLHGLLGVGGGDMSPHGVLRVEDPLGFLAVEALKPLADVVHEGPPAGWQMPDETLLVVIVPPALAAPLLGHDVTPAGLSSHVPHWLDDFSDDLEVVIPVRSSPTLAVSPTVLVPPPPANTYGDSELR